MKDSLKWTLILIFVVLFAWGIYMQTADAAEARLGLSKGVTHHSDWTGMEGMFVYRNWYLNAARLGNDDVLPDTVRLALGYRVMWRDEMRLSPYLRLGGAYFMDEPTDIISDRWAYDMTVGLRIFSVVDLEWQHNSTAGRSLQNSGNDMLLLGMVVPF